MDSNRILGCIFGGALGDAFGGAYEGARPPIAIDETAPLRLSDDTQLTLATCEAVSQTGTVEPSALAEHFAAWYKAGRLTGLGASTLKALVELSHGGHWALVGRKGEMAAGNGAAMRIAPVAFLLDSNNLDARQTIRDVSRITHHNEEAYIGALAVCAAVNAASDGTWTGQNGLIEKILPVLPDSRVRDRLEEIRPIAADTPLHEIAKRFGNSAYVVNSVPLAICAAGHIRRLGFRRMLENVITCGGDTDTNASIAGQISGTLIGYNDLPKPLLDRLPHKELIETTSHEFCQAISP